MGFVEKWKALQRTHALLVKRAAAVEAKEEKLFWSVPYAELRRVRIRCSSPACGINSPLHGWAFVQGRWWDGPDGHGHGQQWKLVDYEKCHIMCPHCKNRQYLRGQPLLVDFKRKIEHNLDQVFDQVYDAADEYGHTGLELRNT